MFVDLRGRRVASLFLPFSEADFVFLQCVCVCVCVWVAWVSFLLSHVTVAQIFKPIWPRICVFCSHVCALMCLCVHASKSVSPLLFFVTRLARECQRMDVLSCIYVCVCKYACVFVQPHYNRSQGTDNFFFHHFFYCQYEIHGIRNLFVL